MKNSCSITHGAFLGILLTGLAFTTGCKNDGTDGDDSGGGNGGEGGATSGGASTGGNSSGGNASTGGSSGGEGGEGGGGGAGGERSACQTVLDEAAEDGCDLGRNCNYVGYQAHCTDGNADATEAIFECMRLGSGCHTPADLGNDDVEECVAAVIEEHGSELSSDVRDAATAGCEDTFWVGSALEITAVTGGDEVAQALLDCIEAAGTCGAIQNCQITAGGLDFPNECL